MIRSTPFVLAVLIGLFVSAAPVATLAQQSPSVDLDDPDRPQEEKERDRWSKPLEVLAWSGIETGDVVVDWHAGTGYATWILSRWVGPEGVVFAEMTGDRKDVLKDRIESGDIAGMGNTVFVPDLESLPTDSLDAFLVIRNYHDYDAGEVTEWLAGIGRTLRPGGLFIVIDAATPEGRDEEGHRIAEDVVIAETAAAGFELVDSSDLLANPEDDYEGPGWDNRNRLDHVALKFRWPGESAE